MTPYSAVQQVSQMMHLSTDKKKVCGEREEKVGKNNCSGAISENKVFKKLDKEEEHDTKKNAPCPASATMTYTTPL